MSMLSMLITDKNIDKIRLQKICLVHDLAESVVGDITPHDGVSKEKKRELEEVSAFNMIALSQ
jgi:putative hydrolases of HD superfamily